MEFFRETQVVGRKAHRCEACQSPIEIGCNHSYMAMKSDGDFFAYRNHLECRAAECGLAKLHHLYGGEDWIFLHDLEPEDRDWVAENHPEAWARIASRYRDCT